MVCFQTKNTNWGKFWRALDWKMFTYIFYGHLEYFTDIGDIVWLFGTFCVYLVHFFRFWFHVPRKIWQPCYKRQTSMTVQTQLEFLQSIHQHTGHSCFIPEILKNLRRTTVWKSSDEESWEWVVKKLLERISTVDCRPKDFHERINRF
jgi:hypothetical protein